MNWSTGNYQGIILDIHVSRIEVETKTAPFATQQRNITAQLHNVIPKFIHVICVIILQVVFSKLISGH
jgi:endonuclease III